MTLKFGTRSLSCLSEATSVTTFELMTDDACSEARVSNFNGGRLCYDVKFIQNDVMTVLIDLLSVESRNSCLSEASSVISSELSTGRMDPRVGSGRVTILPDFGGSGRVSTSDLLVFYLLFLGTWIDMILRILH